MRPANERASAINVSCAHTCSTSPHSRALTALMVSPVKDIRLALGTPMIRGSNQAPPSPGTIPRRTKLSANTAEVDAKRISHMQARSRPAPIAGPLTAAITGMSRSYSASGMRWMPSR
ncbi:hypothetical protein D3C72_1732390 [compost metagenome]